MINYHVLYFIITIYTILQYNYIAAVCKFIDIYIYIIYTLIKNYAYFTRVVLIV